MHVIWSAASWYSVYIHVYILSTYVLYMEYYVYMWKQIYVLMCMHTCIIRQEYIYCQPCLILKYSDNNLIN